MSASEFFSTEFFIEPAITLFKGAANRLEILAENNSTKSDKEVKNGEED